MEKFKTFCLAGILPMLIALPSMADVQAVQNNEYALEKVVVLSRHGLRAPLASGGSVLAKSTPHTWPVWDTPGSYLTIRGGVLEAYFGHYFANWLNKEGLVNNKQCPAPKDVHIYSNSMQRTIATAQYFAVGAYPGCDIAVEHRVEFNKMDPVFNPVFTESSEEFLTQALAAMDSVAGKEGIEGLNNKLKPNYELVAKIVDYKNSETCKIDKRCILSEQPTQFSANVDKEPGITGPLRTATSISDALILMHYEGFSNSEVGWGHIKSDNDWKTLVEIKDWYTDVLFTSPLVAKHISKPLTSHIYATFNDNQTSKFTFLVGHDSNIASVLAALSVKDYVLPQQFEKTPIGGKIVFQRWVNTKTQQQLVKIEYVYQTTDQIRKMEILNDKNPPQHVILQLQDCPVDDKGFCAWSDFEKILKSLI